jgi:hypothetical protein
VLPPRTERACAMLQRLPPALRPTVEPRCPKCKLDMKGINLIPRFPVYCIFQCAKCGYSEAVFPEAERNVVWKDTFTRKT